MCDYKAGKLFYAYLPINWRLVNKEQHEDEVRLAQECFDESHALLGALVPECSARTFSFLSLTLLVLRQDLFL